MGLFVIGVGGSGAKAIEAIAQMAAIGLMGRAPITTLFVDPDESNGNLDRARTTLRIYRNCCDLKVGQEPDCNWLSPVIESLDLWSPLAGVNTNKSLEDLFRYTSLQQNHQSLGHLFDVLYTEEERKVNLEVGFRGRPAIGAAIMSRVDLQALEQEPWGTFLNRISADIGSGQPVSVLLCGSIFGGTGASGSPTLGRLLINHLTQRNLRDRVRVGCLFLLPYFSFSPPAAHNERIYARSEQFLLNTEAALRYYVQEAQVIFDAVYLLGNSSLEPVSFSIGRGTQKNSPHFVELYAGLAARHFAQHSANGGTVGLASRENGQELGWSDLPESDIVKTALSSAVRFAYAWLANVAPELETAKAIGVGRFQTAAPWFTSFYKPSVGFLGLVLNREDVLPDFNNAEQQRAIVTITEWCQDFLRWVVEFHTSSTDRIRLINVGILRSLLNLNATDESNATQIQTARRGQAPVATSGDDLANLIFDDRRDQGLRAQDTTQNLKIKLAEPRFVESIALPNRGTAGLAKALYILCKL